MLFFIGVIFLTLFTLVGAMFIGVTGSDVPLFSAFCNLVWVEFILTSCTTIFWLFEDKFISWFATSTFCEF